MRVVFLFCLAHRHPFHHQLFVFALYHWRCFFLFFFFIYCISPAQWYYKKNVRISSSQSELCKIHWCESIPTLYIDDFFFVSVHKSTSIWSGVRVAYFGVGPFLDYILTSTTAKTFSIDPHFMVVISVSACCFFVVVVVLFICANNRRIVDTRPTNEENRMERKMDNIKLHYASMVPFRWYIMTPNIHCA